MHWGSILADYYPDLDELEDPLDDYDLPDLSDYSAGLEFPEADADAYIEDFDTDFDDASATYATEETDEQETVVAADQFSGDDERAFEAVSLEMTNDGAEIEIHAGELENIESAVRPPDPGRMDTVDVPTEDLVPENTTHNRVNEDERLMEELVRESISREYPPLVTRNGGLRPA